MAVPRLAAATTAHMQMLFRRSSEYLPHGPAHYEGR